MYYVAMSIEGELTPGLKRFYKGISAYNHSLLASLGYSGLLEQAPNLEAIVNEGELEPSDKQCPQLRAVGGEELWEQSLSQRQKDNQ